MKKRRDRLEPEEASKWMMMEAVLWDGAAQADCCSLMSVRMNSEAYRTVQMDNDLHALRKLLKTF